MTQDPAGQQEWPPQAQPELLEPPPRVGWRYAAVGACVSLAALIGGAQLYRNGSQTEQADRTCNLRTGNGEIKSGRVIAILNPQESLASIPHSENVVNGSINPDYMTQQRVQILRTPDGVKKLVAIPDTMRLPNVGEVVYYIRGHRSPGLPCHYTPNLAFKVEPPAGAPQ